MSPTDKEFIVMTLLVRELNGRQLASRYEQSTGVEISFGTLYAILRRLRKAGVIAVRVGEDRRERLFKLTGVGIKQLNETTQRLGLLASLGLGAVVQSRS